MERDALIQRFEFSFELLWKCAKEYLYVEEGIDAASPKKVIRCCRELGLLDEGEKRKCNGKYSRHGRAGISAAVREKNGDLCENTFFHTQERGLI